MNFCKNLNTPYPIKESTTATWINAKAISINAAKPLPSCVAITVIKAVIKIKAKMPAKKICLYFGFINVFVKKVKKTTSIRR